MPYLSMALWPFQGWPIHMAGSLQLSSTPLDTPRHMPLAENECILYSHYNQPYNLCLGGGHPIASLSASHRVAVYRAFSDSKTTVNHHSLVSSLIRLIVRFPIASGTWPPSSSATSSASCS
jgi:hypothetical protein